MAFGLTNESAIISYLAYEMLIRGSCFINVLFLKICLIDDSFLTKTRMKMLFSLKTTSRIDMIDKAILNGIRLITKLRAH